MDVDPSDDETPPATLDVPSTSSAPPAAASNSNIVDAIVALFTHMNVIHTDLVKCVGQVHEHVDLIVERQVYDIVVTRDTLSALSRRHIEFITEVTDFINSFCCT